MSLHKQKKDQNLSQLLYGSSSKMSNSNYQQQNSGYDEIDDCEAKMVGDDDDGFYNIAGGKSMDLSNNFHRDSMCIASQIDDNSREYILKKKKQEIQLNEALDMELSEVRHQLQKKQFEIDQLKAKMKGVEIKVVKKDEDIKDLEEQITELQEQILSKSRQNELLHQKLQEKDSYFNEIREQIGNVNKGLCMKEKEINELKNTNYQLNETINKLNKTLSIYTDSDRHLFDFNGYGQQYESMTTSKKSVNSEKLEKELEKIKKQKNSLEIELNALSEKYDDRENRFRQFEEESRKKMFIKDRRLQDMEQKISQLKDENLKNKTQYEANFQKVNTNLNTKLKETNSQIEKISEYEKRNKSLLEESKKKDEKIRDLSMEVLEKGKLLNEKQKQLEDMQIKQEFDHHIVSQKDKEIEKLIAITKQLEQQIDSQRDRKEKIERSEKLDKNEKAKRDRQLQKQRKEYEMLKKNYETLEKEKEELSTTVKDTKKKLDQTTKKFQSLRASNSELQSQLKSKEMQMQQLKQTTDRALKDQSDYKKKAESIPELKNKIIILESRLKQNESLMRQSQDFSQSINLHDKIQALELRLEDKEKQLKNLKNMIKSNNIQTSDEQEQDIELMEMELQQREKCIQRLQMELQSKEEIIQKLQRELEFKDNTLNYTHGVLVKCEKTKIELEQEKKILEEMIQNSSFDGSAKETRFYQEKIESLQNKIYQLEKRLRQREENMNSKQSSKEYKFQNRQLRERIKELNDALLSKERKITPETMSQQDTVVFLIKTIKKVNRSAELLRLLSKNQQFIDVLSRMQRQFRQFIK